MNDDVPAPWGYRAYIGPLAAIEAAHAALQFALETGTYTRHEIDGVQDPIPSFVEDDMMMFGFFIASGVEHETPAGCQKVRDKFAALMLDVGGVQPSAE
jgi:hypothetical protein